MFFKVNGPEGLEEEPEGLRYDLSLHKNLLKRVKGPECLYPLLWRQAMEIKELPFILNMTQEQAEYIKHIRCVEDDGTSYRGVAYSCDEKWPDAGISDYNPLFGMELCDKAARVLGEDPSKEPWN